MNSAINAHRLTCVCTIRSLCADVSTLAFFHADVKSFVDEYNENNWSAVRKNRTAVVRPRPLAPRLEAYAALSPEAAPDAGGRI